MASCLIQFASKFSRLQQLVLVESAAHVLHITVARRTSQRGYMSGMCYQRTTFRSTEEKNTADGARKKHYLWVEAQYSFAQPTSIRLSSSIPCFFMFDHAATCSTVSFSRFLSRVNTFSHKRFQVTAGRSRAVGAVTYMMFFSQPFPLRPKVLALPPKTSPTPHENTPRRGREGVGGAGGPCFVRPNVL